MANGIMRTRFSMDRDWVAIRDIKMFSDTIIKAGDIVKYTRRKMLHLYRRKLIGELGHGWTDRQLRLTAKRYKVNVSDFKMPDNLKIVRDNVEKKTKSKRKKIMEFE